MGNQQHQHNNNAQAGPSSFGSTGSHGRRRALPPAKRQASVDGHSLERGATAWEYYSQFGWSRSSILELGIVHQPGIIHQRRKLRGWSQSRRRRDGHDHSHSEAISAMESGGVWPRARAIPT